MHFPPVRLTLSTLAFAALALGSPVTRADDTLLNVSYDVTRELYKDINPAFAASWKAAHGVTVSVEQSHGGSTKQAQSVAAGLPADVVTMNQTPDIDLLTRAGLVAADWQQAFPYGATPYTTVTVFLVRRGNPRQIRDWPDLVRSGTQVIIPNPKTSGNGRYAYLAAWAFATQRGGEAQGRGFLSALFANVPVFDGGGRGATTTFTQRGIGDVLVTFENEARLIQRELSEQGFEVVYPSTTIEAAAPVALVQSVAEKRQHLALARAYLSYLYSADGQEIIARHAFRPRDATVFSKHVAEFPTVHAVSIEQLGGWKALQTTHFAEGALYDQITEPR